MRHASFLIVAAATILLAAACGGSGPASTLAPITTPAPGATAAPGTSTAPIPTVASPTQPAPVGNSCAGFPTPDPLASPQPEMARDPELEAKFPTEVDGEPVTDVNSFRWLEYLCLYGGGQTEVDRIAAVAGGFPFANLSYGTAQTTVDDEDVEIQGFRTPGQDAGVLVQNFQQFILIIGGAVEDTGGTMAPATIGGKNAFVWTDSDGDLTYVCVRGDVVFGSPDVTEAQIEKIFAALP